jgi:fructokinase
MTVTDLLWTDERVALNPAVVVGESLVDIVHDADGSVSEVPGGSCANVAVALARLGRPTVLGTSYGFDRFGAVVDGHLRDAGVVIRGRTSDSSTVTSSAVARVEPGGAASYEFDLTWHLEPDTLPTQGPVVHTGSIAAVLPPGAQQVLDYVELMRPMATISYDVNARPMLFGRPDQARRAVDAVVRLSDVVRASDDDLAWLFDGWPADAVAERWLDLGAAAVVITGGSHGATCFARSGTARVDGESVAVIDTIGAGDTFSAGIIDALWAGGLLGAQSRDRLRALQSEHWSRVMTYASRLAGITVSRRGADPPRLDELPSSWRTDVLPARSTPDRHNPDNEMSGSFGRRSQS